MRTARRRMTFPRTWDKPQFKQKVVRGPKARRPIKRTRIKATKKTASRRRDEAKVIKRVRAADVVRDGDCRLKRDRPGHICIGPSEWAHLSPFKRAHTKRMPPEVRHQTAYTMMLCRAAHRAYDDGILLITLTPHVGADEDVVFS